MWTENNPGVHLQKYAASDEHNEADFIVESMMKEHGENHVPYGKMAVLYRMNAQSRVIEESMVSAVLLIPWSAEQDFMTVRK